MKQVKENINSVNVDLSDDVIDEINEIHASQPNPAP